MNSHRHSFSLPSPTTADDAIDCVQTMLDEARDERLAENWQTALLALQYFRAVFLAALPAPNKEKG